MSLAKKLEQSISEEEYLAGERISDIKHEYIDGIVYAMAGASKKHNQISRNVMTGFHNSLKKTNSSCETYSSDMKIKLDGPSHHFFYPDIMVVCDDSGDDYFQKYPVIIVEVLSKSTRKNDFTVKMMSYFNISSLEEYVLIEQDLCQVQVYRKNQNWLPNSYFLGDDVFFESINTTLSVEAIYYHIDNDDMINSLEEKIENKMI